MDPQLLEKQLFFLTALVPITGNLSGIAMKTERKLYPASGRRTLPNATNL
jgi:hypothetical protein